jgi:site-specific DNA recombinase
MSQKPLRAVGYCRTSTESQRDNTSIPTQKDEIERFIERSGWKFIRHYVDESRTGSKIEPRDQFKQMMRDAASEICGFDVVVPWNLKRYGRNGRDIINSAHTLREDFGVYVVDAAGGFDNRDVRRTLTNFVLAGVAEDERLTILERTKLGKIRAAREHNAPLSRWKPVGRHYNKKSRTWTIDPRVKRMYEDVSQRYLSGESIPDLAAEYGIAHSALHRNLTRCCGPIWIQHVRCKDLGIDERIQTEIPPLLDKPTIDAVLRHVEANKTYRHGQRTEKYLLGRMVHCIH